MIWQSRFIGAFSRRSTRGAPDTARRAGWMGAFTPTDADAMPALATVGPSAASSSSASRDRRTIDHQRAAIGGDKGAFLSRVIRAG